MWPTVENTKSHFNPRPNGPLVSHNFNWHLVQCRKGLILSAHWVRGAVFEVTLRYSGTWYPDPDILAYLVHIVTSTISPHKQQIRQFSLSPLSLSASGAGQGDFFVWEYDHVLILTQENDYRNVLYASSSHFGPEVLPCQGGGDVAAGLVHGVVHLASSLKMKDNWLSTLNINQGWLIACEMRITLSRRPGIRLNFEKSKPK